ncbi:hypothetical protein BpHYR1_025792 [Brachionus plicatilis]|uniref:Uncharacterized protein n=1 Tax=Brachionus plicatilis TaxID=10195 RepID=A0A3M7Q0S8_BRAPC|nr:hypothetical protein BpHYR1_025792 [Brachionus plicatilis]
MNRNFLKENWNESHTLKKLRNRRIINPILNSDTIDSNVQTTEQEKFLSRAVPNGRAFFSAHMVAI